NNNNNNNNNNNKEEDNDDNNNNNNDNNKDNNNNNNNNNNKEEEEEEEEEYEFPLDEGIGLYAIQGTMNHSCDRNIEAYKRDDDLDNKAVLVANKNIKIGDE